VVAIEEREAIDRPVGCRSREDGRQKVGLAGGSQLPYGWKITIAGQFIADLQRERRSRNVSSETEQHLKHEFRKLGWDAPQSALAAAAGEEIDRLDREAATLRRLRADLFGTT